MNYKNPYEDLSGKLNDRRLIGAGFSEKTYDTGNVRLNYVVGPNNGPSLLLIPAQMGMWESYKKVLLPLSNFFQVYAIDVRGHGKSSWTPGYYSWKIIGEDIKLFIENVIKQKVIISGNSSGGIIALWCAANIPEYISGIILEDAPIFSAEMPRFKEQDKFVYNGLEHLVNQIGNVQDRDLANYFKDMEVPASDTRIKKIPNWFVSWLSRKIKQFQSKYPDSPIEIGFPDSLRLLIKSLSMFDPDFARAFVDGRFYDGIDHAKAFEKTKCPILLIHADWKRYENYGLVGAFDDDDAQHAICLAPQIIYKKVHGNHVIHAFKQKEYIKLLSEFRETVSNNSICNGE